MNNMELLHNNDLTANISPFLDPHMISPLLDFLSNNEVYEKELIIKEKIKCVLKTNMITVVEDEYEKLINKYNNKEMKLEYENKKENLEKLKENIFNKLDNPPNEIKIINTFFENKSLLNELKSNNELNINILSSKYNITSNSLDIYYKYGKFYYECGMYNEAENILSNYLLIQQYPNTTTNQIIISATWGKLSSQIVQGLWDNSKETLKNVKDYIEHRNYSQQDQIRQRAWLLHWSLFVYFTQSNSYELFLDLCERPYILTMQNMCPWLYRYYAIAILLSNRRKQMLKDLLNDIHTISYLYSDPILGFITTLYDSFNIDETQLRLKEALAIMKVDFFLCVHVNKFADLAKMLMCEMYCTMHAGVDLQVLANKLELSLDDAEMWMVSMIKNTTYSTINNNLLNNNNNLNNNTNATDNLNTTSSVTATAALTNLNNVTNNARIDSSAKHVILAPPSLNIYQQIVDKTRDLNARSAMLNTNMNTLLQEQAILIKNRPYL